MDQTRAGFLPSEHKLLVVTAPGHLWEEVTGKTGIFLSLSAQGGAGVGTAPKVLVCTGTAEQALGSQAGTEMEILVFPQQQCSSRLAPHASVCQCKGQMSSAS